MNKKSILFLSGGLGNQMFQYSFYNYLRHRGFNVTCDYSLLRDRQIHNGFELERIFKDINVDCKKYRAYLVRILYYLIYIKNIKIIKKTIDLMKISLITENDENLVRNNYTNLILGYWQSTKFIELEQQFQFKEELINEQTKKLITIVTNCNSISIHVRRGDYLTPHNQRLYGGICTIDYYDKAIKEIIKRVENPKFFVFSNDINWVKENLSIPNPLFLDFNKENNSWQDLYLMSKCRHNIIANSTFSWWGAWLNQNPKKIVISPLRLTNEDNNNDVFPSNWIRIQP